MSERAIALSKSGFLRTFTPRAMSRRATTRKLQHSRRSACIFQSKGITEAEMKDAFDDLTQFMAAAIKTANDDEVARLASEGRFILGPEIPQFGGKTELSKARM